MAEPVKNVAYTFYTALTSQASAPAFQANPTLATGDVKVSLDGGALANIATLPSATPASSRILAVALSQTEMNHDDIVIQFTDASGAEWHEKIVHIQTTTRGLDNLAYPTTSGRSIDVTATGEVGIDWSNIGAPTTSVNLSGTTIAVTQKVDVDTIKTNPVVNGGTITFPTNATVASTTGAVGSVTGAVGSVTGAVGSVTGAVGSVTGNVGGNVIGSIGSLAAQAKADVNAEVVDTLATDTYAEPGQEAPAATNTIATKLGYLFKAWRNKSTQTATAYNLFADDTTTVDQKATVSDDATTATKGEIGTGP